jgi:type VI secretion system secreted protein VgrG
VSDFDQEHAALRIEGRSLEVVGVRGSEAISELFRYEVTCSAGPGDNDPHALVGRPATLTLRDGMGMERTVGALVAEAEERAFDNDKTILTVVLRPDAWALTLGRDCRVFQDKTVPQIIAEVLASTSCFGRSLSARWELSGAHGPHVYCAQYREDSWSFVRRLCEEEGIYLWFDHHDGESTLVFGDDSSRAPELAGGAAIAFTHEAGTSRPVETVLELGHAVKVAPSKFSVGSFNPDKPKLAVEGAHGGGALEVYEAEGGLPDSPEACARLAKLMGEAAASGAKAARGTSTSVRLVPGMIVQISGHPFSRLDGRYLVVESRCRVAQRRRGAGGGSEEERGYENSFRVVPAELAYRTARVTPKSKQPGLQIGEVVGPGGAEVHPDPTGRVRVQHHWDRQGSYDDKAGKWMRVAQRGTADSMLLPRIGWNVATFNDEGEIDAPAVLSRFHDAEHPPAYPLPANKTRVVWKTATTPGGGSFNEMRHEDKAGEEDMLWNASKDMTVLVQNDRQERVSNDVTRKVGHDHSFHVKKDYDDTVKRDQTVAIGNDESITVHGKSTKVVTGDEINTIAGKRSVTSGGKHLDQVKETRQLTVGAAQIDTTLGPIGSTAKTTSILVGGAMIRATFAKMAESCDWVSIQTIGGAKIELAKKSRTLDVKKMYLETVGGAISLNAGGAYRDHAEKASSWTVAGIATVKAPVILLEAEEKIVLKVGANVLTITPKEIAINALDFDLSQASAVVANTTKESHN